MRVRLIIHVEAKVQPDQFQKFKCQLAHVESAVFLEDRVDAKWGSYNLALSSLKLIEHAAAQKITAQRYLLMSGQDYPIFSNEEILDCVSRHSDEEFMEYERMDIKDETISRWSPYYRFRRYHYWVGKRRLVLPLITKRMPDIPVYHGAQWWLLTGKAIQILAREFRSSKRWDKFMSTGFLTDEAYILSLIMSSEVASKVVGKNVTYADWRNPIGPHPKTLTLSDLDEILASGRLFARKFDMDTDASVLDSIDERIAKGH